MSHQPYIVQIVNELLLQMQIILSLCY